MTVYLFTPQKTLRRMIPPDAVTELVHDEANYSLSATIRADMGVKNGDCIGFQCVDGHFRLFSVTRAEDFDDRSVTIITGTDAIVQELKETIVEDLQQLDVGLKDAILGLMAAAGQAGQWSVTGQEPERVEKSRAYYTSVWAMLETYTALYEWRIVPYYVHSGGRITQRVIALEKDEAVFRGRILRSKKDASNVYVIHADPPITRVYGIGKATGTEDEPSNLTFAEVAWSKASGDPADKPQGQTWVEDAEAVGKYGVRAAVITFPQVEDDKELMTKSWEELQKRKEPSCTVEATIQDLEQVPGHEHQIIRLGDLVPIRLANATMEAARVIGIKRDYIRHWLTKLTIGAKTATIQSQVSGLIANATHTFERLTIHKNRFHEDEALIQLNAEMIQMNAEIIEMNADEIRMNAQKILANAELIELKAGKEEVTELGNTVSAAMIRLDGAEAEIQLKASRSEMTEAMSRLSNAEIRLDGAEALIELKADRTTVTEMGAIITQAQIDINGALAQVNIWAGTMDEFGNRLDGAEILVNGMESRINLKADKTTVDAMGTRVSNAEIAIDGLTAEIKLVATDKSVQELAERVSQAEIRVDGFEAELDLMATQSTIDGLVERVSNAEVNISGALADILLKADRNTVTELTERVTQAEIDIDGANAQISLMATQDEVDGINQRLNQAAVDISAANAAINMKASASSVTAMGNRLTQAEVKIDGAESSIELLAEQIRLAGYVTMDEFEALEGQVSNLVGGLSSFTVMRANTVSATQTSTTYLSTSSFTFAGSTVSQRSITMGSVTSAGKALTTGAIDLSHSHKVTVNSDGTITLGEVATSGGSFKIADTAYYKNGVSAAKNSVTITSKGWQGGTNVVEASNGKSVTVNLPTFSVTGGDSFNSSHKTTVYFSTSSVNGYLKSKEVDASSVYTSGVSSGKSAVTISAAGWQGSSNVVSASNGKSVTVNLPTFSVSGGDSFNSSHKTTVYFSTPSVSGSLKSKTVDATSVYNSGYDAGYAAGYQAAKDATTVVGGITSIVNTAQNYYMATGWASARVDGEQVDYTTFSKAQYFS